MNGKKLSVSITIPVDGGHLPVTDRLSEINNKIFSADFPAIIAVIIAIKLSRIRC